MVSPTVEPGKTKRGLKSDRSIENASKTAPKVPPGNPHLAWPTVEGLIERSGPKKGTKNPGWPRGPFTQAVPRSPKSQGSHLFPKRGKNAPKPTHRGPQVEWETGCPAPCQVDLGRLLGNRKAQRGHETLSQYWAERWLNLPLPAPGGQVYGQTEKNKEILPRQGNTVYPCGGVPLPALWWNRPLIPIREFKNILGYKREFPGEQ